MSTIQLQTGGGQGSHAPLDPTESMRLAQGLLEAVGEGQELDEATLDTLAVELEAPKSHLYLAAALVPQVRFKRSEKLRVVVCAGGCQMQGSGKLLERLEDVQRKRREANVGAFDIATRRCLDRCFAGPVVQVELADGRAGGLPRATPDSLEEAVVGLCDSLAEEDAEATESS